MLERRLRISGKSLGERRGSNPRMVAPQATALPLGYARHLKTEESTSGIENFIRCVRKVQDLMLNHYKVESNSRSSEGFLSPLNSNSKT